MKGDFTRNTFNPLKHFTRVLMQQGRVQLDADWNEQTAILLHYLQTLAADLIGSHGGPSDIVVKNIVLQKNCGFEIIGDAVPLGQFAELNEDDIGKLKQLLDDKENPTFLIGKGRYYVRGILCENEHYVPYIHQPDLHPKPLNKTDEIYLVYLDVWERHITYLEDGSVDDPNIREVALGGPDTATRAKVIWQVKVLPVNSDQLDQINLDQIPNRPNTEQRVLLQVILELMIEKFKEPDTMVQQKIEDFKKALAALKKGRLRARAHIDEVSADPCTISPEARYRGAQNRLYRVEVHRSGRAWDKDKKDITQKQAATFKWSRENGSVIFPISDLMDNVVTLKHLGRDSRFGLAVGDWVEIVDDEYVLENRSDPLLKIKAIDPLTLDGIPTNVKMDKHPLLRRWDHKEGNPRQGGLTMSKETEGASLIVEGEDENQNWLILEDGVQIQFQKSKPGPNHYCTGDYWLIPARTATGDVEWPGPSLQARPDHPHGVKHHYAPLGVITLKDGTVTPKDLRHIFTPLGKPDMFNIQPLQRPIELRTGWLRMPFRPIPFENKPKDEATIPLPFRVGATEALTPDPKEAGEKDRGAGGTMAIPVPPNVKKVTGFRIAGAINEGEVICQLIIGGWDRKKKEHVHRPVVDTKIASGAFAEIYKITDTNIDAEYHTLSLWLRATRRASVSLVAVEFAY